MHLTYDFITIPFPLLDDQQLEPADRLGGDIQILQEK